jgi:hypothetical protein
LVNLLKIISKWLFVYQTSSLISSEYTMRYVWVGLDMKLKDSLHKNQCLLVGLLQQKEPTKLKQFLRNYCITHFTINFSFLCTFFTTFNTLFILCLFSSYTKQENETRMTFKYFYDFKNIFSRPKGNFLM